MLEQNQNQNQSQAIIIEVPSAQAVEAEWGPTTLHGVESTLGSAALSANEAPGPRFDEPSQPFNNAGTAGQDVRAKVTVVQDVQKP